MALKVSTGESAKPSAVWRDFDDSTSILVDSLDNAQYQVALERGRRRIQARDRAADLTKVDVLPNEETEHAMQCRLMGQFVILGWRGATDAEGNPVPYSPAAAAATLRDDIEFFVWTLKTAADVSAQHQREADETLGKSSTATAGNGSGAGVKSVDS